MAICNRIFLSLLLALLPGSAQDYLSVRPNYSLASYNAPLSVVVDSDGQTIFVNWPVAMSTGAGWSGSNLNIDGTDAGDNVTGSLDSGSGTTTWTLDIGPGATILQGAVCDLDWDGTADSIEETSGGADLGALSNFPITNNSTQTAGTVEIDTSVAFSAGTGGATTRTINITVASNSNRVLYVVAGTGFASGTDETVSVSSDVDGAFTEVAQSSDSNWVNAQVWRLNAPTAGAHVITVTFTGNQDQSACTAICLYGVNSGTPNGTPVTTNGTSTAPSASATLASGDLALGFLVTDGQTGVSVSVGTQRQEVEDIGSDTAYSMATNTGTGSVAITWTTTNDGWAVVLVPINAQ